MLELIIMATKSQIDFARRLAAGEDCITAYANAHPNASPETVRVNAKRESEKATIVRLVEQYKQEAESDTHIDATRTITKGELIANYMEAYTELKKEGKFHQATAVLDKLGKISGLEDTTSEDAADLVARILRGRSYYALYLEQHGGVEALYNNQKSEAC